MKSEEIKIKPVKLLLIENFNKSLKSYKESLSPEFLIKLKEAYKNHFGKYTSEKNPENNKDYMTDYLPVYMDFFKLFSPLFHPDYYINECNQLVIDVFNQHNIYIGIKNERKRTLDTFFQINILGMQP